jgi:hypothetical protein
MKNIIKCERCGSTISSEFFDSHECHLSNIEKVGNIKEIFIKHYFEVIDAYNNILLIKGWDGILYRIIKSEKKSKLKIFPCYLSKDLTGIAEIPIICYYKPHSEVIIAIGQDGIEYRFVVSKTIILNPYPTDFDTKINRRRLDRTRWVALSSLRLLRHFRIAVKNRLLFCGSE